LIKMTMITMIWAMWRILMGLLKLKNCLLFTAGLVQIVTLRMPKTLYQNIGVIAANIKNQSTATLFYLTLVVNTAKSKKTSTANMILAM